VFDPCSIALRSIRPFRRTGGALLAASIGVLAVASTDALAAASPPPSVAPGFTITKVAPAPNGATNCDDIAPSTGTCS